MDHFRVRGKGIQLASNTVVKACANGNQQVALLHRKVRRFGAVHAQHTGIKRIVRRNRTQAFQRDGGRHISDGDKFAQRRNCLCHTDTTTDIQHRFASVRYHFMSLLQLGMWHCEIIFNRRQPRLQITLR
ncbi:hypothetical protein D3C75_677880 [compost metagenome]